METHRGDAVESNQVVRVLRQLNSLIESILSAVRDINDFDDFRNKSLVEHIGLSEISFEVCTAGQNYTADIDLRRAECWG